MFPKKKVTFFISSSAISRTILKVAPFTSEAFIWSRSQLRSREIMTNCKVCNGEAKQKCSGCFSVFYCSKNCQISDWRNGHKADCRPFEVYEYKCEEKKWKYFFQVKRNEKLGRYMVAARDLKAGEVLFREFAVVHGPKMVSNPICLGCHGSLSGKLAKGSFYRCSHCAWPLCSKDCENLDPHVEECKLMASKNVKCPIKANCGTLQSDAIYCLIFPLRFLLMKKSQPKM